MAGVCGGALSTSREWSFGAFSERLDTTSISTAISTLQNANVCRGNYDQHFIDLALKRNAYNSVLTL